jgi:hypothetical protein
MLSLKNILIITLCASLMLPLFFVIPLVRVARAVTYVTWYSDGRVESVTEEDVFWVTPYQCLFGGELFFDVTDLDALKEILKKVCFKEEYRPPRANIGCGEKSAILMKYLEGKGCKVSMGRGTLSVHDEEIPHAWVLVHLKNGTYVVEVNTQSGYADIVGTVKDAAECSLKFHRLNTPRPARTKIENLYICSYS